MIRFRVHFLEFDLWLETILYAPDAQSAREAFSRERPSAAILGLHRA
jgi:hypothetical protein